MIPPKTPCVVGTQSTEVPGRDLKMGFLISAEFSHLMIVTGVVQLLDRI